MRIGVGFVVHPAKSFFELPSDVQNAVKDEMKKWPSDSKAYKDIVQLATSNGFLQHSPAVQKAMVARKTFPARFALIDQLLADKPKK